MPPSTPTLSHLDEAGQVRMVDVIAKTDSERVAIATASVRMNAVAYGLLTPVSYTHLTLPTILLV